jgi:hypothetical protein
MEVAVRFPDNPAMKHLRILACLAVLPFMTGVALAEGARSTTGIPVHSADATPEAKCAVDRLTGFAAGEKPVEKKLVFVYFSPADRDPPPGYRQRLAGSWRTSRQLRALQACATRSAEPGFEM